MNGNSLRPTALWAWRHPLPRGATGRCIGHTDLRVDPRRAKGLARRIQSTARRHGLPRVVHTSPLARCTDVGRWLKRWGWRHVIDANLTELDFGRWDGLYWNDIEQAQIDAWCADFPTALPGGGEPLCALLRRAAAWRPQPSCGSTCVIVAHAGWMLARRWAHEHPAETPQSHTWPAAPAYEARWLLPTAAATAPAGHALRHP
jgi:alpha-ribazole phosphatase